MGIARQIRDGMVLIDGLSAEEANRRFWCVDRNGLLVESVSLWTTLLGGMGREESGGYFAECDGEIRRWRIKVEGRRDEADFCIFGLDWVGTDGKLPSSFSASVRST